MNVFRKLVGDLRPGETTPVEDGVAAVPAGTALAVLGVRLVRLGPGIATTEVSVSDHHTNQVGVVQGGIYGVIGDATAGWACMSVLPEGKTFSTIEMRTSALRAARPGDVLRTTATAVHSGRSTMLFEARTEQTRPGSDSPRTVAFFVCTQLVMDL
ncbi:MAG: hypothetical protein ABS81_04070 [Pseudonocardia sp. SCN 72-86]|nr:MAG: hypothetical protein ABS81_04070 [Pseudonocardia sp. SCN 72-86]